MDDLDLDIKINAAGNSYVTGWVTVVEVLTPDGDKALITETLDSMTSWGTLGFLQHAMDSLAGWDDE